MFATVAVAKVSDSDDFGRAIDWKKTLKVKCPHCGKVHRISVRETYLNNALSSDL